MRKQNKADPYNRRLSIVVPNDLYEKFYKHFEWGERNRVMVKVIEWIVNKVDEYGRDALFLLLRDGDLDQLVKLSQDQTQETPSDGNNI